MDTFVLLFNKAWVHYFNSSHVKAP